MNIMSLVNALPGAAAQGLIWGIMAIGVYITYRILDFADLTVDGSLCTGGAVCIMLMLKGQNVWVSMVAALLAGMAAGCGYVSWLCDWIFSYIHGNSGNFIWYFNTAWSVVRELENYGKGESGHQCRQIQAFGVPAFY